MLFTFILVIVLLMADEYLDERGRYHYSVLIGIKGDDDSIEDYRIYANNMANAKAMAMVKYCEDNRVYSSDLNVYAVERI